MSSQVVSDVLLSKSPFVQCPHCEQKLPLRIEGKSEQPVAAWKCSNCGFSVNGYCEMALLLRNSHTVSLDDPYFDVGDDSDMAPEQRQTVAQMARRGAYRYRTDRRRAPRAASSFVAPAICLTPELMPFGEPFRVLVTNVSRDGAGLVNQQRINAGFIAMLLTPVPDGRVQVILKIIRQRQLKDPYYEIGGEFHLRLGSKNLA